MLIDNRTQSSVLVLGLAGHHSREQDVLPEEQGEQQAGQHGLEVVMVKLTDAVSPDQAGHCPLRTCVYTGVSRERPKQRNRNAITETDQTCS